MRRQAGRTGLRARKSAEQQQWAQAKHPVTDDRTDNERHHRHDHAREKDLRVVGVLGDLAEVVHAPARDEGDRGVGQRRQRRDSLGGHGQRARLHRLVLQRCERSVEIQRDQQTIGCCNTRQRLVQGLVIRVAAAADGLDGVGRSRARVELRQSLEEFA